MEAAAILEIFKIAIPILTTGIGAVWALWENIKKRRYADAVDSTTETLNVLVMAIEAYCAANPNDQRAQRLKAQIQQAATLVGTQSSVLKQIVNDVTSFLESTGLVAKINDPKAAEDVAWAMAEYNKKHSKEEVRAKLTASVRKSAAKIAKIAGVFLLLGAFTLPMGGCAPAPPRMTTETITVSDPELGISLITVRFPEGTATDAELWEIMQAPDDGRMLLAVPYMPPTKP